MDQLPEYYLIVTRNDIFPVGKTSSGKVGALSRAKPAAENIRHRNRRESKLLSDIQSRCEFDAGRHGRVAIGILGLGAKVSAGAMAVLHCR